LYRLQFALLGSAWRLTCRCSCRFPSRLPYSRFAQRPRALKARLGAPMVSNQVAPIAASTRGSNAWRTFQATPDIARAILGTARQRTREGISGIRSPAARSVSAPRLGTTVLWPSHHRTQRAMARQLLDIASVLLRRCNDKPYPQATRIAQQLGSSYQAPVAARPGLFVGCEPPICDGHHGASKAAAVA
jgi:hypothetical protein